MSVIMPRSAACSVDLLFYKKLGQTGASIVNVEMYICIANSKTLLKVNLVDHSSSLAYSVSPFRQNRLYYKEKKSRRGGLSHYGSGCAIGGPEQPGAAGQCVWFCLQSEGRF